MINAIKQCLSSLFELKDMGEAKYVLGVTIVRKKAPKYVAGGKYRKSSGMFSSALFQTH